MYEQEWHHRKTVMEAIFNVLRDGKPRKARQILHALPYKHEIRVNKKLVSSILCSEAKRYVLRDNKSFTYRMRPADEETFVQPPWDIVRAMMTDKLHRHGPLTVNELKDELECEGIPAPKWMIKAILSDDSFRVCA